MAFKEIKGHQIPVSFIRTPIEKDTVAHAYLFAGIDGIGKVSTAVTFAKALNCQQGGGDSCDICTSCRKIDSKNHPDVLRIAPDEAQATIKISSIRAIGEKVSLRPYEAKKKVCIIEDAHLMTAEASNSLLKTLEEPPPDSVFILTTSNIAGLFRTIVSRCQVVKFSPLSRQTVEDILVKKFGFRKEAAQFIARLANGSINKKMVLQGEDFISWKNRLIDEFMDGSFLEEGSAMFSGSRKDLGGVLLVLVNWYRDILVYKNGSGDDPIINFDRAEEIRRLSRDLSHEAIDARLTKLVDAHVAVGQKVNAKLIIGALA